MLEVQIRASAVALKSTFLPGDVVVPTQYSIYQLILPHVHEIITFYALTFQKAAIVESVAVTSIKFTKVNKGIFKPKKNEKNEAAMTFDFTGTRFICVNLLFIL